MKKVIFAHASLMFLVELMARRTSFCLLYPALFATIDQCRRRRGGGERGIGEQGRRGEGRRGEETGQGLPKSTI